MLYVPFPKIALLLGEKLSPNSKSINCKNATAHFLSGIFQQFISLFPVIPECE